MQKDGGGGVANVSMFAIPFHCQHVIDSVPSQPHSSLSLAQSLAQPVAILKVICDLNWQHLGKLSQAHCHAHTDTHSAFEWHFLNSFSPGATFFCLHYYRSTIAGYAFCTLCTSSSTVVSPSLILLLLLTILLLLLLPPFSSLLLLLPLLSLHFFCLCFLFIVTHSQHMKFFNFHK